MTSWRTVLRERQLAIDAADREELEAKKKCKLIGPSEEFTDSDISYRDVRSPEFSSSSAADAAAVPLGTSVPEAQLIPSGDLQDSCECNTLPVLGMSTACSSGVENLATDQEAVAACDVIEVIQQSSPATVGFTDEVKSTADYADAESVGSVDFAESDQISSSVIDSPSSHQQRPFESLPSTPEHLVSDSNVLSFTSDCSEMNFAGELPRPLTETATLVESAVDIQLSDHKRTRRHAQKHGDRAKKKHRKAVHKAETIEPSDDAMNLTGKVETESNDYCSNTSGVHSLSEQLDVDTLQSSLFEKVQHSDVVPDATVTDDFATQVVRHPSYLKAVGIRNDSATTSWQQNSCSDVVQSAITQASKDHSSSRVSDKTGSKWSCSCYLCYLLPL